MIVILTSAQYPNIFGFPLTVYKLFYFWSFSESAVILLYKAGSVILLLPVILGELMSCLTYPAKKIKALVSQRLLDLGDTLLERTLLNIWKTVYKCLVFFPQIWVEMLLTGCNFVVFNFWHYFDSSYMYYNCYIYPTTES